MGKSTCCIVCALVPGTCTPHQSRALARGTGSQGKRQSKQNVYICTCARAGDPAAI